MKIIFRLIIFVTSFILAGFLITVNGQENLSNEDTVSSEKQIVSSDQSKVLHLEIQKLPQEYPSKILPLELTVTSDIDIDNLEITWQMPYGFTLETVQKFNIIVKQGEPQKFTARIKPERAADATFIAKATSYRTDILYFATQNIQIKFNDELEATPQTQEYLDAKAKYQIRMKFIYGISCLVLIALISFGVYKFKEWLDKD